MKEKSEHISEWKAYIPHKRRPRNVTAAAAERILFDLQFERIVLRKREREQEACEPAYTSMLRACAFSLS